MTLHHDATRTHAQRGFSLIELVIAVAILAIVASLAYPSFMGSVRKGRRAEAFAALSAVQQAQERWRANNAAYASDLTAAAPAGLGLSSSTSGGLYTISIANTSGTGYEAVATAVAGTSQASDSKCSTMGVRMANGNLSYNSASNSAYAATNECWSR